LILNNNDEDAPQLFFCARPGEKELGAAALAAISREFGKSID
jgi:hypothetical protein